MSALFEQVKALAVADAKSIELARYRAALELIADLVDGYVDVEDGEDGPRPNLAMRIQVACDQALGRAP